MPLKPPREIATVPTFEGRDGAVTPLGAVDGLVVIDPQDDPQDDDDGRASMRGSEAGLP